MDQVTNVHKLSGNRKGNGPREVISNPKTLVKYEPKTQILKTKAYVYFYQRTKMYSL